MSSCMTGCSFLTFPKSQLKKDLLWEEVTQKLEKSKETCNYDDSDDGIYGIGNI